MKKTIHKAESRGHAHHGWLDSHHTFSFADYYDPNRMNFGALRVINDDIISGGQGFGTHPHQNMEIVSIPIYGSLSHKDSMGHEGVITQGEVQAMSAGTGVMHSEFNGSETEMANFLQIWVMPEKINIEPCYEQKKFNVSDRFNKLQTVVAPLESNEDVVKINQQAYFSLLDLEQGHEVSYSLKNSKSGVYTFVIEGQVQTLDEELCQRDAMGVEGVEETPFKSVSTIAKLLIMEVPL